ncbi:unnamed protein product [Leptidea sinapis]|uniref:Uncharacterized protein n=1 Tax=Leptidea sinapis TaxID=189913 RepID=A0A5E4R128_9NEOP|nr:unnamed protein product [Leptidea sinapis]
MDALKDSLNAMSEMFEQKMSECQQGLDNGPITNTSLAAEFNSFRTFVLSAMNTLQRQVEFLGIEVDRLEMRRRCKMLLVHGVSEDKSEDVTSRVCKVVREHLGDWILCCFHQVIPSLRTSFRKETSSYSGKVCGCSIAG